MCVSLVPEVLGRFIAIYVAFSFAALYRTYRGHEAEKKLYCHRNLYSADFFLPFRLKNILILIFQRLRNLYSNALFGVSRFNF